MKGKTSFEITRFRKDLMTLRNLSFISCSLEFEQSRSRRVEYTILVNTSVINTIRRHATACQQSHFIQFHNLHQRNYIFFPFHSLHIYLIITLSYSSSSFTFGKNRASSSFHSLNHDLFTILDVQTLTRILYMLTTQVVIEIVAQHRLNILNVRGFATNDDIECRSTGTFN